MRDFPQRLAIAAPVGSLFKPVAAPIVRTAAASREEDYLKLVRACPCLKCGLDPCGEAAHCRITSAAFNKRGGMAKRPADRWALPLDRGCHLADPDALHRRGEYLFWSALGLNPLMIASRLYAKRDDLAAMRAVIFAAIAERR